MAARGLKLRTSSDASIPPRPNSPIFFLDRSIGRGTVASKLREAGFAIKIHDDYFPQNDPDEHWLSVVGQKGWLVFTKDKELRYRSPELLAIVKGNAKVYSLVSGNMRGLQMAEAFVKAARQIVKSAVQPEAPCILKVLKSGKVQNWVTREELLQQFPG